ncbi:MAG: UDP-N-acetylglucosamine 2-epimerase [Clostridiales bacterium]|jgi:GDP/UDP-N,N'-diacetylbacillosamine 2-epimerase (hydrolysing)|nr:UDP-N-acetylglucosamine 2-epimerase [Clostridiales bacterium]
MNKENDDQTMCGERGEKKSVCAVTGTRAEYGLLSPLLRRLRDDPELDLRLVVTGMHLCAEFGSTCGEIEQDGFVPDARLETLLSSDTGTGMAKSAGLGLISFADYFAARRPDILIVLGDRFEIFAAAAAAAMSRVPIAHIGGGDTSEGAVDEFMRHSITKMSYLHFASNGESARRILRLGESPDRVFNVGALNVENILSRKLLERNELSEKLGMDLRGDYALVTFHPVTQSGPQDDDPNGGPRSAERQAEALVRAVGSFPDMKFLFTKANADSGGRAVNAVLDRISAQNCRVVSSLGALNYLSAMKYANAVIGNSSSGIYETPVFGVPAIDIGDRQKGRTRAGNVVNCKAESDDIVLAIKKALSPEFREQAQKADNPFGDGKASSLIINHVREFLFSGAAVNLAKSFYSPEN